MAEAWERRGLVEIVGGYLFDRRSAQEKLRRAVADEVVIGEVSEPPATRAVKKPRRRKAKSE